MSQYRLWLVQKPEAGDQRPDRLAVSQCFRLTFSVAYAGAI
jgi:hypothetical protein